MQDINGFSDHEILVDLSKDLKQHIKDSTQTELDTAVDLERRPTRREILGWLAGASTLVGLTLYFA